MLEVDKKPEPDTITLVVGEPTARTEGVTDVAAGETGVGVGVAAIEVLFPQPARPRAQRTAMDVSSTAIKFFFI